MNPLTERLRPHVGELQKDAASSSKSAARAADVINLYRMYCASPHDPGAPALCEAAFEEWVSLRNNAT